MSSVLYFFFTAYKYAKIKVANTLIMFNLKTADIEISCLECENNIEITIQDVLGEKTVNDINSSFIELEKTLKNINK